MISVFWLALWLQMSAPPQTRVTMYESMCRLPRVEYGERYRVIVGADECFIFERSIGEVYWRGPHGEAILFPIGSPLDDITRAEFAEAAQRSADETDGKPPKCYERPAGDGCNFETVCGNSVSITAMYCGPVAMSAQKPTPPAESVDVPAVQRHEEAEYLPNGEWPYTPKCPAGFKYGSYHSDEDWPSCEKFTYTCEPKSRILEHDENSPPKYWCRKVQP